MFNNKTYYFCGHMNKNGEVVFTFTSALKQTNKKRKEEGFDEVFFFAEINVIKMFELLNKYNMIKDEDILIWIKGDISEEILNKLTDKIIEEAGIDHDNNIIKLCDTVILLNYFCDTTGYRRISKKTAGHLLLV